MKRYMLNAISVLGVGWVLTLGLFYERGIESTSTVLGSNSRLCPNMWINTDHVIDRGIPYLLSPQMDQPPYPLSFCFTALEADTARALCIDRLEICYADGTTQIIKLPAAEKRAEFSVDDRGKSSVNFSLLDAIQKRQAFNVKVDGFLETELGRESYREEIAVAIVDKAYFYPGWIALWLQGIP